MGKQRDKMIRFRVIFAGIMCASMCGCETKRIPPPIEGTKYGVNSEIVSGEKQVLTMHDLDAAARSILGRMRASSTFAAKCKRVEEKRKRKPLVVVGGISNLTGARIQDRLDAIAITARASLYDTEFIEVKDDEAADKIKKRIHLSADGGLETGDLLESLGEHDSPDFIVLGDLRQFEDMGIHSYRLRLAVHSLTTGMIAWEGIQTIEKYSEPEVKK